MSKGWFGHSTPSRVLETKEKVTADTPMTVGMFYEYMARRDKASADPTQTEAAIHRAMQAYYAPALSEASIKACEEKRTRIPAPLPPSI
jgi:DNA-binding transcriptional regulator of glucitol operon